MSNEIEQWRDVPGYSGYQASTLGRVRSVDLTAMAGRGGGIRRLKSRVLRPQQNRLGYQYVSLGRKQRNKAVHRLVAAAFIGPCPDECEVNHKDGSPPNNDPANLEYVTHRENMQHAASLGRQSRPPKHGESNHFAKYTDAQVRHAYAVFSSGKSITQASRESGVPVASLKNIFYRGAWSHLNLPPLPQRRKRIA
ncbi:MAG: HNH endonuclease [Pirellulales bacterium]|nr:HNH endonuclease [Pirellulales bacterium]